MNRSYTDNVRNNTHKVSHLPQIARLSSLDDAFLLYNGAFEAYEDPADYIRLKGGRIA